MIPTLWIFSHKNSDYAFDFNNWYRLINLQVVQIAVQDF